MRQWHGAAAAAAHRLGFSRAEVTVGVQEGTAWWSGGLELVVDRAGQLRFTGELAAPGAVKATESRCDPADHSTPSHS